MSVMNEQTTTVSTTTEMTDTLPLRERPWFKIFLCTLYSIIFVLGVVGNATVCFIIYQRKKLKTVTNLFILNLAVSDLIFAASIPFEFPIILRDYEWPYASFFCKIYSPVQTITFSVSIFTLTAVSLIRKRAINNPLKRQVSHSHANYIMLGIWTFSTLLMIPHFVTLKMKGSTCDEEWPHMLYRKIYTTLLFVVFYFIPLIIVVFAYTKIVEELRKKKNYHNTALNEARDEETSRVIRMLIKVTVVFALCNLPSQLMWLWLDYGNADKIFEHFWDLLSALNILIFANSAANPLIYYIFHDKFRSEVFAYLKKIRCQRRQKKHPGHKLLCPEQTDQAEQSNMDSKKWSSNTTSFHRMSSRVEETTQETCV